ncbi:MAG: A24 family peptidase [Terracidiphilus sp.]
MHSIAWWPTVVVVLMATFTDLRSRRIPNWLVLPFLVAGIAVSVWFHGWHGLEQSFAGIGLGILIYGLLFWMGGMGAGDVKLCAAIGAWIGPGQLVIALVVTGLAGGVMVLCWAAWGGFLKSMFNGAGDLMFGWMGREEHGNADLTISNPLRRKIPYAPAIAIGTLISFFAR